MLKLFSCKSNNIDKKTTKSPLIYLAFITDSLIEFLNKLIFFFIGTYY